jgi:Flp pilus assembly protein TadB
VVAAVTRWPVAAFLAACAAWALPALIGPDRQHRHRLARIEAIATWTEALRDTLGAAAGLQAAIAATATLAPPPIHAEVTDLARRLRTGDRLTVALRDFATQLDDPTADLVVTALIMAAERNAGRVGPLLTSLAATAREQASLRMRVAAARATVRTSTRVISTVTLAMAAGLALLNRSYLAPYNTLIGQVVLLAIGALFAAGLYWLARIAAMPEPPRLLGVGPMAERHSVDGVIT